MKEDSFEAYLTAKMSNAFGIAIIMNLPIPPPMYIQ